MSSPSEFLTFYRMGTSVLRSSHRALPRPARPARAVTYTVFSRNASSDMGEGKKHATQKKERLDVQSDSAHAAKDAKSKGTGGHATSGSSKDNLSRAKKDHPEAPDAAIGFQDERGGKGH